MPQSKKPLEIDMCAGSQIRDTQGEVLDVKGADISNLTRFNDNHGAGFFNSIGRVTFSKKIFKKEDCEDDRQHYYWEKIKSPYIYVKGVLFDDEDHPNAKAAAAILRNIHKSDCPLKIKASVEGGVISRGLSDPSLLARTKIHSIALTFTPANNATLVEPIAISKSSNFDEESDQKIIKSVMHLAKSNVPSFRHIIRDAAAEKIQDNLAKIQKIACDLNVPTAILKLSKSDLIEASLRVKINKNIDLMDSIVRSSEQELGLEKGFKEMAAGAALLGATSLGSPDLAEAGVKPQESKTSTAQVSAANKKSIAGPKQVHPTHTVNAKIIESLKGTHPDLGAIACHESTCGKFIDHKTIKSKKSVHYGHTAGSMFGIMPNSASYALNIDKSLKQKYPKMVELSKNVGKNHKQITDILNGDPHLAKDFAITLYSDLSKRLGGKSELIMHAWNHGLGNTLAALKQKDGKKAIRKDEYVSKTLNHLTRHTKEKKAEERSLASPLQNRPKDASLPNIEGSPLMLSEKQNDTLNKALIAGYGGAAAPTNRSGGSILQSESFDFQPKKLKHVVCDKCGKEQVYAKYQVKCRSCNSPFSLEKIYKVIKT